MIAQALCRTARAARLVTPTSRQAFRRQASTSAPKPYRFPMPVEAYPIVGITVAVAAWLGFSITKHIYQDRDHLRWAPGMGGLAKYELQEDAPIKMSH